MSKFEDYIAEEELNEGFLTPDRYTIKLYGKDEEDLKDKIDKNKEKYKSFAPKVGKMSTDKLGRLVVNFSYNKHKEKDDTSVVGLVKRGAKFIGKKVAEKKSETMLRAKTESALKRKMNKLKAENPNVEFMYDTPKVEKDGTFYNIYKIKQKEDDKPTSSSSKTAESEHGVTPERLNNIQLQLKKLQSNLHKMTPKDLVDINNLVNDKVNK